MLKKIALGLLLVPLVFVLVILLQPGAYHVERSAKMAAAPPMVFNQVNNLHRWQSWSPWEKRDPDMKRTFEGPEEGKGAVYAWSGNDEVGEGKMTIVECKPGELVRLKLEFLKPYEGRSDVAFTFTPDGKATKVNWSMDGANNFVGKAFSLFMNIDETIGKDFDEGLANLKKVAEAEAAKEKPALAIQKNYELEPGDARSLSLDARSSDQKVIVEVNADGPVNVFIVLGTDYETANDAVLMGKSPEGALAAQTKQDKATVSAVIPSGKGFTVVVGYVLKRTRVKVRLTGMNLAGR